MRVSSKREDAPTCGSSGTEGRQQIEETWQRARKGQRRQRRRSKTCGGWQLLQRGTHGQNGPQRTWWRKVTSRGVRDDRTWRAAREEKEWDIGTRAVNQRECSSLTMAIGALSNSYGSKRNRRRYCRDRGRQRSQQYFYLSSRKVTRRSCRQKVQLRGLVGQYSVLRSLFWRVNGCGPKERRLSPTFVGPERPH